MKISRKHLQRLAKLVNKEQYGSGTGRLPLTNKSPANADSMTELTKMSELPRPQKTQLARALSILFLL